MKVNKYIFREYDIRGKVNEDFPPEVVLNLGKAFGTFIKRSGGQEIALSGDVRLSTPSLIDQFKVGGLSTGIDVINIEILPTPVNYYSLYKLEVAASVQITGSHNPPEFNGFKLSLHKKPVYGAQIQLLKTFIDDFNFDNEISFIKIDVEGHEIEVIEGGKLIMDDTPKNVFSSL